MSAELLKKSPGQRLMILSGSNFQDQNEDLFLA